MINHDRNERNVMTTWSELVLVDRTGWSIMTGTRERS